MKTKSAVKYLPDGARVYTTGAFLRWDKKNQCFKFDGLGDFDDTFYDGKCVNFDENGDCYTEKEG